MARKSWFPGKKQTEMKNTTENISVGSGLCFLCCLSWFSSLSPDIPAKLNTCIYLLVGMPTLPVTGTTTIITSLGRESLLTFIFHCYREGSIPRYMFLPLKMACFQSPVKPRPPWPAMLEQFYISCKEQSGFRRYPQGCSLRTTICIGKTDHIHGCSHRTSLARRTTIAPRELHMAGTQLRN